MVITLGSAPIATRSFKIKMMTRSSSESELVSLEECSTYASVNSSATQRSTCQVRWTSVHQDNKSTIIMAVQGSFKRIKNLVDRESFVGERIRNGDIVLQYLATTKIPGLLTNKPLGSE
jgi:hypothetical protein